MTGFSKMCFRVEGGAALDFVLYYLPADITVLLDIESLVVSKDSVVTFSASGPKDWGYLKRLRHED